MSKDFKPTTPDYTISAMTTDGKKIGNVGAAWKIEEGRISIKINSDAPDYRLRELKLMMFPYSPKPTNQPATKSPDSKPRRRYEEIVTLGSPYPDGDLVWSNDPTPNGPHDVG